MKKVVRLTEGQFIDFVKKVLSESIEFQNDVNEQSRLQQVGNAALNQMNAPTPTPAWVKKADSNLNFNAKAKMGYGPTQATYLASTPDGDMGVIIPKGSKFTPAGAVLVGKGYLVHKESLVKNGGLTWETLYTDNAGLAKALKSGKLSSRGVNIALTSSGTVVYEGAFSAIGLLGNGSVLAKEVQKNFA